MLPLFHAIGFGLISAAILAVASMGLTIQFGITNYVNFAYGDFMTLGAFLTWSLNHIVGIPFWWAMPIGAVGTGLFALFVGEYIYEPFVRHGSRLLYILIVSFGVSLMTSNAILAIWGGDFKQYSQIQTTAMHIGPFLATSDELIIVAIALTIMIVIHLGLTRTRMGKAMRAMSDDTELARINGIPARAITRGTWLLSGVLAGIGGSCLALNIGSFDSNMGVTFLFFLFAVIILGGIGRPYGAMLGALVIGLSLQLATLVMPAQYTQDIAFIILVLVLLVRPQGLLGVAGKTAGAAV